MALTDTLTTREAVRRATLDDLLARAELLAVVVDAGADLASLDGLSIVSMGKLRDQVSGALMVALPPPSETTAEVSTPASVVVSAYCPECKLPVKIVVILTPELVVDASGAELKIKAKAKKAPHQHGQLSIDSAEADGQLGMDDIEIEDHRLRILRAVATVGDRYTDAADKGEETPPPTLDAIASELELATEADRFDLQDSLQGYAQADPALVAIDSETTVTTYALTDAGSELVDDAATLLEAEDDKPADGDQP